MNVASLSKDEYHAAVYEFLRRHYKHDRFEGSPDRRDFPDYPHIVTASAIKQIERLGYGCVSHFEDVAGEGFFFDANLEIIPKNVWRERIRPKPRARA